MAHPWDMMAMSPCPPRLRWSPGVCEWSSRALRSILAHAATAPLSARAGKASKSVGGETESTRQSTTTTCRPGVRLCSMSMCRGGANHIPAASACLPCLSLSLFRTLLLRGTVVIGPRLAPRCLPVCLSACLSLRLASILVCASPPLSALCSVLPSCKRAHTGLASSGRARCRRWRCP